MSFNPATERINEIKRDLAAVREAIRETISGGANISVAGGVSIGRVPLKDLRDQESSLVAQLRSAQGGKSYTLPDWGGNAGNL